MHWPWPRKSSQTTSLKTTPSQDLDMRVKTGPSRMKSLKMEYQPGVHFIRIGEHLRWSTQKSLDTRLTLPRPPKSLVQNQPVLCFWPLALSGCLLHVQRGLGAGLQMNL